MCNTSFKCSDYSHLIIKNTTLCSGSNCEKLLGKDDDAFYINKVNKIICNQCCLLYHSLKCRESKGYINKARQYNPNIKFIDDKIAEEEDAWYDRHI